MRLPLERFPRLPLSARLEMAGIALRVVRLLAGRFKSRLLTNGFDRPPPDLSEKGPLPSRVFRQRPSGQLDAETPDAIRRA